MLAFLHALHPLHALAASLPPSLYFTTPTLFQAPRLVQFVVRFTF